MEKYTLIYGERIGSSFNYITCIKRVMTNDLTKLLQLDEYKYSVHSVFEGWPKMVGEKETNLNGTIYSFPVISV